MELLGRINSDVKCKLCLKDDNKNHKVSKSNQLRVSCAQQISLQSGYFFAIFIFWYKYPAQISQILHSKVSRMLGKSNFFSRFYRLNKI